MKNNKGITLISLTLTVIVLIILASVTTYSGISTIKSSKLTAFRQELEILQAQVDEWHQKYETNATIIGRDIEADEEEKVTEAFKQVGVREEDKSKYKIFDKKEFEELGISGIENTYLINIEKKEVISLEGYEANNIRYYTLEQLTGRKTR